MSKLKKTVFTGAATAIITPFKNGAIDYASFKNIIEQQIAGSIDAIVVAGTTGEAATLSDGERYELYSFAKDKIDGRCALVLGTGTNDTEVAVKHTKFAEELGCDGALIVTPYYNKGTERGIIAHYRRIAETTSLPIMLYNVPSRTGVNMSRQMLEMLAEVENIVAIKEAADSADKLVEIASMGERLQLYAGNDTQLFTTLALGGGGVVSVVSNLGPERMMRIVRRFKAGDIDGAREEQTALLPLIKAMFRETNPAPIKHAMARVGLCAEEMRLPLTEVSGETRRLIDIELSRYGYL
jgi:4-hydroxy-tetrahydrodipicolinate synthase